MSEEGFLGSLTRAQRDELQARGRPQRFARATALLTERQVGDRVMLILSGRVKITRPTSGGREVVLGFRGPGDLLGEQAALDGQPRSGTAVAVEAVEVLTLSSADFREFLTRHPEAAVEMMRLLSERLRDADRKRTDFAATDTVGRVAARLVELAERFGELEGQDLVIALPMTQEDLAGWCGASREATAKALQTLRTAGWVATGRRRITIHDLAALRQRSG